MRYIYIILCVINLLGFANKVESQTISYTIYAINYRNYNNNCDGFLLGNEEGRFFPQAYDNVTGWTGCPGPNYTNDNNYPNGTGCDGNANGVGYNCAKYRLLKNVSNTAATQFGLFTAAYEDDGATSYDCATEDCASSNTVYYNFTSYPQCTDNDIVVDAGGRYQITFRVNWRYTNVVSGSLSASATSICPGQSVNFNITGGTAGNKPRTWIGAVSNVGSTTLLSGWNECSDCYDNQSSFSRVFNTPGVYLVRTHSRNCADEWNWGSYSDVWITVNSVVNNPGVITAPAAICVGSTASISNVTSATTGFPASAGPNYYYYYQRTSAPVTGWVMYNGPTTNLTSALPAAVTGTEGTYLLARNSEFGCAGQVSAPFLNLTVDQAPTLGTLSNPGPIDFCNAGGNFTTAVNVSGQVGSVMWDWGSNNGVWNNNWVAGANSGICCFPKKVSNSDGNADRIRYRVTNGSCPAVTSSTILIRNRFNEAPTNLVSSTSSYCSNSVPGTITLTANFPTTINMNGTVSFYSGSCGGTLVGSVSPAANSASAALTIAAPTTTTTYFARYEPGTGSGCSNSACVSATINVNTPSTAPSIVPMVGTICPNTDYTLVAVGGIAGSGSTINWYSGPSGTGTWLGSGASLTVTPIVSTTYYARREGTCNNTADASVTVNVKTFVYAANGTSTNNYCTDNAGWHHFYSGDEIIFSLQGDISTVTAGFPIATIHVNGLYYQQTEGPGTALGCSINQNPNEERFEMRRSWNLDMGGASPVGTYNIRFYYQPSEKTAIETAASNWMSTYPDCGYNYKYPNPLGFYWFKNSGSNYSAPDYDGTHYAATISSVSGVNYAQLTGIPSFSGGSGAVILEPISALPVELTSFAAVCEDVKHSIEIQWSTASENNSSHFTLERSVNGVNWKSIGSVDAAGNSNSQLNYSFLDLDARGDEMVYYRLYQFDIDGVSKVYGPVSAKCLNDQLGFDVFPNPAGTEVTVLLYGEHQDGVSEIIFSDINGKEVKKMTYNEGNGKLMKVDLSNFESGVYLVRLVSGISTDQFVRLIKQ